MDQIETLFREADRATRDNNFQAAIKAYEQIIEISKSDARAQHIAYWGIGEIYLNNKQYPEAESFLKKAIELAPDEADYHYLLGCTYTYMNKINLAIGHLEKAIELDDSKDIYWDQLGWVYGFNRDVDQGIKYLKRALNLNPSNTRSLRDICLLYTKKNKWNEALVCIEEAMEHDPYDIDILRIKKDIEHFQREFEKTSSWLRNLPEGLPLASPKNLK